MTQNKKPCEHFTQQIVFIGWERPEKGAYRGGLEITQGRGKRHGSEFGNGLVSLGDDPFTLASELMHEFWQILLSFIQGDLLHRKIVPQFSLFAKFRIW